MSNIFLQYADVRRIMSAMKTQHAPMTVDEASGFLSSALGIRESRLLVRLREVPVITFPGINLTNEAYFSLLKALEGRVCSTLPSRARVEIVAAAFGWRGDAFMHHLKTTTRHIAQNISFNDPRPSAIERIRSAGFVGIDAWLVALNEPTGLCLIGGPTSSGKSTFQQMCGQYLYERGASITVDDELFGNLLSSVPTEPIRRTFTSAKEGGIQAHLVVEIDSPKALQYAVQEAEHSLVVATVNSKSILHTFHRLSCLFGANRRFPCELLRAIVNVQLLVRANTAPRATRFPVCEIVHFTDTAHAEAIANKLRAHEVAERLSLDLDDLLSRGLSKLVTWKTAKEIAEQHLAAGDIDQKGFDLMV